VVRGSRGPSTRAEVPLRIRWPSLTGAVVCGDRRTCGHSCRVVARARAAVGVDRPANGSPGSGEICKACGCPRGVAGRTAHRATPSARNPSTALLPGDATPPLPLAQRGRRRKGEIDPLAAPAALLMFRFGWSTPRPKAKWDQVFACRDRELRVGGGESLGEGSLKAPWAGLAAGPCAPAAFFELDVAKVPHRDHAHALMTSGPRRIALSCAVLCDYRPTAGRTTGRTTECALAKRCPPLVRASALASRRGRLSCWKVCHERRRTGEAWRMELVVSALPRAIRRRSPAALLRIEPTLIGMPFFYW
jgi:hypothetical protein